MLGLWSAGTPVTIAGWSMGVTMSSYDAIRARMSSYIHTRQGTPVTIAGWSMGVTMVDGGDSDRMVVRAIDGSMPKGRARARGGVVMRG